MRRYRMVNGSFDTRAHWLNMDIPDHWEQQIKEQHLATRAHIVEMIAGDFGSVDLDRKLADFAVLGPEPFSVLSYHNTFFRQVRRTFVAGGYYPALVGCCALGERILNHLMHDLKHHFAKSVHYKKVYDKGSFDDWDRVIGILEEWGVLLPEVATSYRTFKDQRNAAIHFRPAVDQNARELALDAVTTLGQIITGQFSMVGAAQPWYFGEAETYIREASLDEPFVSTFIVPAGLLVGPWYELEFNPDEKRFFVADVGDVGPEDGSDEDFITLRTQKPVKA